MGGNQFKIQRKKTFVGVSIILAHSELCKSVALCFVLYFSLDAALTSQQKSCSDCMLWQRVVTACSGRLCVVVMCSGCVQWLSVYLPCLCHVSPLSHLHLSIVILSSFCRISRLPVISLLSYVCCLTVVALLSVIAPSSLCSFPIVCLHCLLSVSSPAV